MSFTPRKAPPVAALAQRDLLRPLSDSTLAQVRQDYVASDGTWAGITARCRVTVYRPDQVAAEELPESVLDMATSEWQNRVAFVPTSRPFPQQLIPLQHPPGR